MTNKIPERMPDLNQINNVSTGQTKTPEASKGFIDSVRNWYMNTKASIPLPHAQEKALTDTEFVENLNFITFLNTSVLAPPYIVGFAVMKSISDTLSEIGTGIVNALQKTGKEKEAKQAAAFTLVREPLKEVGDQIIALMDPSLKKSFKKEDINTAQKNLSSAQDKLFDYQKGFTKGKFDDDLINNIKSELVEINKMIEKNKTTFNLKNEAKVVESETKVEIGTKNVGASKKSDIANEARKQLELDLIKEMRQNGESISGEAKKYLKEHVTQHNLRGFVGTLDAQILHLNNLEKELTSGKMDDDLLKQIKTKIMEIKDTIDQIDDVIGTDY